MKEQTTVRIKVLAWLQQDNCLFVVRMHDSVKGDDYYRPVGGCLEFGETTQQALQRELMEELNTQVDVLSEPMVLENIFTCDGIPGHEIVFLYPARFSDTTYAKHQIYPLVEANGAIYEASWINIDDFLNNTLRLVPEGLLDWYCVQQKPV
ncbi:MAG TPA: NUDIX domain-containing protein [Anaerolineaceae bacterium]|nr:NUDIX domain-containing protein [Anaerolineaceae bacterium]